MKEYRNIFAVAFVGALFIGGATFVFAETETSHGTPLSPLSTTTPSAHRHKGEWKLEIGPAGRVLLRGNIESISGNTLKIKSWGGVWTVRATQGVEVLGHDLKKKNDVSQFAVGDFVGIHGVVSSSEVLTIDGKVVRNWTETHSVHADRKENEKLWKHLIKDARHEDLLSGRIFEGILGTTTGASFTLEHDGIVITVTTSTTTKFIDRNWSSITMDKLKSGDKVRVFGDITGATSVVAEVLRDTSIPREVPKSKHEKEKNNGSDND